MQPNAPAEEGETFFLYESREKTFEKVYVKKVQWLLNFDSSVRGLNVGAPVEFKGIKVGEVTNINLEFDWEKLAFRVPVLIDIEPERLEMVGEETMERGNAIEILVGKGLRAQLKQGSLLTGQLFVDLDIHPDAPPKKIIRGERYVEFPTVPTSIEEITGDVIRIVDKLSNLPLEQIGDDLRNTMKQLSKTIAHLEKLAQNFDKEVAPATTATIKQAEKTLTKIDRLLNAESPMGHEMKRALEELSSLSDYLERHPEALIKGKGTNK
ncbi:MAG: MCE family protein [Deltaproteobacteria bacterium]|nr:MCE family protein [Deltaproteobacteria bacterium]